MVAAVDITIKKYDGTTDIVWSLVSASGGDRSPALWRSTSAAGFLGQKPTVSCASRWNGTGTARRIDIHAEFPSVYTDSTTSLTQVNQKVVADYSIVIPQGILGVDINEATFQIANLVSSLLFKQAAQTGFAPV